MEIGAITEYVDVAQVVLYVFWVFFFLVIFYLHTENKREGYPLVSDHIDPSQRKTIVGLTFMPDPKTFKMADGTTVLAPDPSRADKRPLKASPTAKTGGSTIMPEGDPMLAEVGPGSYAERADHPDWTHDGKPKMVPMRVATDFHVDENDPDPRGMTVVGTDGGAAGTVTDIWVDLGEFCARFLEMEVAGAGGKKALLPITMVMVDPKSRQVQVEALHSSQFAGIPSLANPDQVTRLEEERIYGYLGAGTLYATSRRAEPLV